MTEAEHKSEFDFFLIYGNVVVTTSWYTGYRRGNERLLPIKLVANCIRQNLKLCLKNWDVQVGAHLWTKRTNVFSNGWLYMSLGILVSKYGRWGMKKRQSSVICVSKQKSVPLNSRRLCKLYIDACELVVSVISRMRHVVLHNYIAADNCAKIALAWRISNCDINSTFPNRSEGSLSNGNLKPFIN